MRHSHFQQIHSAHKVGLVKKARLTILFASIVASPLLAARANDAAKPAAVMSGQDEADYTQVIEKRTADICPFWI